MSLLLNSWLAYPYIFTLTLVSSAIKNELLQQYAELYLRIKWILKDIFCCMMYSGHFQNCWLNVGDLGSYPTLWWSIVNRI